MIFENSILFALVTYGLTLLIALMVAGIITIIQRAVKLGDKKKAE
ncbi:hypothetical protein ACFLXH_06585 [Chloroflexota bacterium]